MTSVRIAVEVRHQGEPRRGTIERRRRADGTLYYLGRIALATGKRHYLAVPDGLTESAARDYVADAQRKEDERGGIAAALAPPSPVTESPSAWFKRWIAERRMLGLRSVDTDEARIRDYVLPFLKSPSMASVTRDHVEDVRDGLDVKIRSGALSWKTAANAWGLITKAFSDAVSSKNRALRCRADNPAMGVQAPERGARKAKVYLFPSEVTALLSCKRVPLRWRRFFALTVYTYARPGEVRALDWDSVDLDRGIIHIHKSIDRNTGELKSTKTETSRRIAIEPELAPLLHVMRKEQGGKGRLVPWGATDRKLSRTLQQCLRLAGVKRPELFASDAARKPMTFYDLRATGITWMAVRGDDPLRIKQRAGHSTFSTTEGYIREAENLTETAFGQPFPRLPEGLLMSTEMSTDLGTVTYDAETVSETWVGEPGLEPGANRLRVYCSTN